MIAVKRTLKVTLHYHTLRVRWCNCVITPTGSDFFKQTTPKRCIFADLIVGNKQKVWILFEKEVEDQDSLSSLSLSKQRCRFLRLQKRERKRESEHEI